MNPSWSRWIDGVLILAFLGALSAWGYKVWTSYEHVQTAYNIWGNARMAFSDAGVWLRGGLRFFFGMSAEPNLYRPTIGVVYASLIAFTGTTISIALFPLLLFLIALPVFFVSCGPGTRPLVLAFVLVLTLFFGEQFGALFVSIGTMMTEAMVWAFTLIAYLLIVASVGADGIAALPAAVGFVILGMAAAARGLQLGGGLVVFCGLLMWFGRREPKLKLAGLFVALAAPCALDALLQRHYGIRANALQLIYVFVQPPHTWVRASHWAFLRSTVPHSAVVGMFFNFMLRSDGIPVLLRLMADSAHAHLVSLAGAKFSSMAYALSGLGVAGAVLTESGRPTAARAWAWLGRSLSSYARAQRGALIWAAVNLLVLMLVPSMPEKGPALFLVWLSIIALISLRRRMPFSFVAVALYLGSLALFIVTCSPGGTRTAATFVFALYFALIAFGWEIHRAPRANIGRPRPLKALSWALAGTIVCLYVGFLVVPRSIQTVFRTEVLSQSAAMKLAGDKRIDRSLYINGDGVTFFTRWDDEPLSSVVRYKALGMVRTPKYLTDDPGYEPMQIVLETSLYTPIVFIR